MNFNSELELVLNDKALSSMKEFAIDFAYSCVMKCSRTYEFDGEEAVKLLGLRNPVVKSKITKQKRVIDKPKFVFPYNGGRNAEACQGLILNGGLFTQCEMSKKTQLYCGKCSKQAEKNSHGTPNYGTIMDRNSVGIMEYIDPTGKCPVSYMKFIKKKKWDLAEVQEEAKKYSININEIHFVEENSTKKRGRKPRVRSQVAYDTDEESSQDMFDTIIEKTNEAEDENPAPSSSTDDDDEISAQFSKLEVKAPPVVVEEVAPPQAPAPVVQVTEPPKPAEPPQQDMAADDLEEEIEEKVEAPKEQRKKSEKKTDKSEKLKQKEIEKQRKLEEKEMEKKRKEEEASAKALEKLNKAKTSKSPVQKASSNSTEKPPSNTKADMFCTKGKEPCIVVAQQAPQAKPPTPTPKKAAAEASVSVKPFTHDGVKYYKSPDNILYDKNGNPQGKWDETTKTITPVEDAEEEEEEEDDEDANSDSEEEEEEYEDEEELGSARYASVKSDILDEIEYYECLESN